MKVRVLATIGVLLLFAVGSHAKEWRNIVPFKSNRTDVERLLGQPGKFNRYQFETESVAFRYAKGPCEQLNDCECLVPKDTVLEIIVTPEVEMKFCKLKIDRRSYKKNQSTHLLTVVTYLNDEEGIIYTVDDDEVIDVTYVGSKRDCREIVKRKSKMGSGPESRSSHTRCKAARLGEAKPGWNGVVPLYSTRADVERLLGVSSEKCRCIYKTSNEVIFVDYAEERCKSHIPGWNVPSDTVLRLQVSSSTPLQFTSLNLDLSKYKATRDDTFNTHYGSKTYGIEYSLSSEGVVNTITYIPSSGDSNLRCTGFPQEDGSFMDHITWQQYGDLDFPDEDAILDGFVIMLRGRPELTGYIVVYAGKEACRDEAKARASRARNYIVNKRQFDPRRIKTLDGGFREKLSVELYALPPNTDPPTPVPTISQTKVKLINGAKCQRLKLAC